MIIHNLTQGSPEWKAYRATHFNASDAPAMMGCSPYKTRAQLLREMHTGLAADVDAATQKRFDDGHRAEALARPLAEKIIGEILYPVTGSEGRLSASFDGLTLVGDKGFEHKSLNDELRAAFNSIEVYCPQPREKHINDFIPMHHRVQMEQQLLLSGADCILFMASEWTADGELVEERHCWYFPDAALRQQIIDGWAQFEKDLAAYVLPEPAPAAPVGRAPQTLPALRIEVKGSVIASNLAEFKQTALSAIRSVNKDLRTDADFADADKAVKWCAEVESKLKAAKEHALSQTASIDELFKALDEIAAESKAVRLDLAKVIDRRKVEVKEQAVIAARRALDDHITTLNAELAPMLLQPVAADFAGAIKGLRSIASMQDALDTNLATAKIAADAQARGIRKNVDHFKEAATGMEALFSDLSQLVHKAPEDFRELVQARVLAQHERDRKAEEARKADEARRIAEAEAKARAEEAARFEAEQRRKDEEAAAQRVATLKAAENLASKLPEAIKAGAIDPEEASTLSEIVASVVANTVIERAEKEEPPTLKLGQINERLGYTVTADLLARLGFVAHTDRQAKLFRESEFPAICAALAKHTLAVSAGLKEAA